MLPPKSNPASATSQSLIWKLRQREESGWQRMVELYTPLIYHWCRQSGFGPDETADLTQDILRSVVQSIDQFQRTGANGTFRGWLRTIFKSRVVDHVRRNRSEPAGRGGSEALRWLENAPELSSDDETDPATKALFRRVLNLIEGEFNGQAWQAFWMTTVEERSAREVAAELAMTPGAVRQAKYRVLRRVREELGDVD